MAERQKVADAFLLSLSLCLELQCNTAKRKVKRIINSIPKYIHRRRVYRRHTLHIPQLHNKKRQSLDLLFTEFLDHTVFSVEVPIPFSFGSCHLALV